METTLLIKSELIETYQQLVSSVIGAAPKVLTGLILLIVALVVSKLVERLLRGLLSRVGVDSLAQKVGIDQAVSRIGIRQPMSQLLPRLVYFLLLFLFARTAADGLGLTAVSQALGSFLAFMPNLVSALLILLLGSLAGPFAGRAVGQAAKSSGFDAGSAMGSAISGLILFIAGIMAFSQLGIDTDIVRIVTFCSLAGLALAFGLSFGLGSREVTHSILAGFYARRVFVIGQPIEIQGQRGTLKAITPTLTLLDQDGKTVSVANTVFLRQAVKQ